MEQRIATNLISPTNESTRYESVGRLVIANGTIEALKWIGLIFMTLDHVNKYLFNRQVPGLYEIGRLAMPLFVFVLAYNMARPGALQSGAHWRAAWRLMLFGVLSTIPFVALRPIAGAWWPLNMLFGLFAATVMIGLLERNRKWDRPMAIVVFIAAGGMVEFWWFGLALAIACWWYCKKPDMTRLLTLVLATMALDLVSHNVWALGFLPLILIAPRVELAVPRIRLFFYVYYPAHLCALWLIAHLMGKA